MVTKKTQETQEKNTTEDPEYMTKTDVAQMYQISTRQVENLVKAARLPPPIRLGSHPRWRRSTLMAFLDRIAAESDNANC